MITPSGRTVIIALLLTLILVLPAGAVTLKSIRASVAENGDTTIVADYSLNWAEQAIAYPAALPLVSAASGKNTRVVSISPGQAEIVTRKFATVRQKPGAITYSTPPFSLSDARRELDKYWFGDMITLDAGSTLLTIVFPDGEMVQYRGLDSVPSFEHTVIKP
jgi:hypothetical protein